MDILKLAQQYFKLCVAEPYRPRNIKQKVLDIFDARDKESIASVDVSCTTTDKNRCTVDIFMKQNQKDELRKDSVKNKLQLIRDTLKAVWKNVEFIVDLHC